MPTVYDCLNALQAVKWRVNKRVFEVHVDAADGKVISNDMQGSTARQDRTGTKGQS